jgi:hypothetical protein
MCYPQVFVADAISAADVIKRTGCKLAVYTQHGREKIQIIGGKFLFQPCVSISAIEPHKVDMYLFWRQLCDQPLMIQTVDYPDTFVMSNGRIHFNGIQIVPYHPFTSYVSCIWMDGQNSAITKGLFIALSAIMNDDLLVY